MTATAVQAGAYLHHLQFESEAPERLAGFYGEAMNMAVENRDGLWTCAGPGRRMSIARGTKNRLAQAGFACRDREGLDALRERAKREGLDPKALDSPMFLDGAFAVRDPDGNEIVFGLARQDGAPREGLHAPLQHLTLATFDVGAIENFYANKLGFLVSDRVVKDSGEVSTCFMRSNHEHHTLACFKADRRGVDHHSYEAGEWIRIRDWADRFGAMEIPLMWGPGRHGPGNNLFIFIKDPDENWIEVSAELEVIHDRPVKHWPHAERTLNLWGRGILRS